MYKNLTCVSGVLAVMLLSACTQSSYISQSPDQKESPDKKQELKSPSYSFVANDNFEKIVTASTKREKDRAAILAMQGEHKVSFDFQETVVLKAGYERKPAKHSGGFETVILIEESPSLIVLQHILVVGDGHVVKHWRQDWHFEAKQRFEFVADQTWERKLISSNKHKGMWTQCVYEVSDAPRYCGTGKWNHRYGVSTWTSDRTWRPLPRREYTTRDDYNALNVENRHTVTPMGWTHEQDNTKTVREGSETKTTLVREFGFNNYQRVDGVDFSPAYDYWEKTSAYWQSVRTAWSQRFANNDRVILKTQVDGMPIIEATFGHAEAIENGSSSPGKSEINEVLNKWVTTTFN